MQSRQVQASALVGQTLKGQYRIDGVLGEGAMGIVLRGVHLTLDKPVAVKVLRPEGYDPERLQRFEREARTVSQLSHPGIAQVFDYGVEDGLPYLVMEFIAGDDLTKVIAAEAPMPPLRAIAIVRQLADALAVAHQQGVVHRDIKPANLKLLRYTAGGRAVLKVLDFGVAKRLGHESMKLTSTGAMVGTPLYMSPDQATSEVDGRADLYSVGIVFYEMLTGRVPFHGDSIFAIVAGHLSHAPPPLPASVPASVQQVVMRLLRKRPEERYQDAGALDRALEECEEELRPASARQRTAEPAPKAVFQRAHAEEVTPRPMAARQVPAPAAEEDPWVKYGGEKPTAALPVAQPVAAAAPPVERRLGVGSVTGGKGEIGGGEKRQSRWVVPALLGVLAVGGVGAGIRWVTSRPGGQAQSDAASAAAMLLVEVDADLHAKRWGDAIDKVDRVLQMPNIPPQTREGANLKRDRAQREKRVQATYDRFVSAAGAKSYDDAVQIYKELPGDSAYHALAQDDYSKVLPLFIEQHLRLAEEARVRGACQDRDAEVQKVLDVTPAHIQAQVLKDKPCPERVAKETPPQPVHGKRTSPKRAPPQDPAKPDNGASPGAEPPAKGGMTEEEGQEKLQQAQSAYVDGDFSRAIELARPVTRLSPLANRAWRIVGAAACGTRDPKLILDAFRHVDDQGRQYILYLCQRRGMERVGTSMQFKLAE